MATKRVTKKAAAPKKAAKKTVRPRKVAAPRKLAPQKAIQRKAVALAPDDSHAWRIAVAAAESKKAEEIRVLDLRPLTSFADYLIICHGTNPKQVQAIADEVELTLKKVGERVNSVEGYNNAEWILLDYGDFVVNVFSQKARAYYDLEHLWQGAPEVSGKAITITTA